MFGNIHRINNPFLFLNFDMVVDFFFFFDLYIVRSVLVLDKVVVFIPIDADIVRDDA